MKKIIDYHILQVFKSQDSNFDNTKRTISIQIDFILLLIFITIFFFSGLNLQLIKFLKTEFESINYRIIFGKSFLILIIYIFLFISRKKLFKKIKFFFSLEYIKTLEKTIKLNSKIWNFIYRLNFIYLFGVWWIFSIALIGLLAKHLVWIPFKMMQ
jgi:hypothetical protein